MTNLGTLPQRVLSAQAGVLRALEESFPVAVPPISQTLAQVAASIPAAPIPNLGGGGAPFTLPGLGNITATLEPAQGPGGPTGIPIGPGQYRRTPSVVRT